MAEEADARDIADDLKRHAQESENEEDLKMRVEFTLRTKALEKMGINWAKYEHAVKYSAAAQIRSDALYGRVIIEYERPGTLAVAHGFEHAVEQAKGYIDGEAGSAENASKYFGVVLDGFQIGFVRFRANKWQTQGPFSVSGPTILKLLEAIRGLKRKPLRADLLRDDLGPSSNVAKKAVKTLYIGLTGTPSPRIAILFEDWKRVFRQVCGYSPEKTEGLEKVYGMENEETIDHDALLFSIHTYFGFVMKLIASEIAVLYGDSYLQSYIKKLEEDYFGSGNGEAVRQSLEELESGGIFSKIGIKNFLEADYFGWYLDIWDEALVSAIIGTNEEPGIIRVLADYEPATAELEPDSIKDLLKQLYQFLIPKKIRHDLGEYYTPDWLAELALDEVGYNGNPGERILDPACGSGTFLVQAIKRVRKHVLDGDEFIDDTTLLHNILENVVGFDLNPLAVIASRTNYLLSLSDLMRSRKGDISIPVYLADSIMARKGWEWGGLTYTITTSAGKFAVPAKIVEEKRLGDALTIVNDALRMTYTVQEFSLRCAHELDLDDYAKQVLERLYKQLTALEKKGKNRIWLNVIKNSFAPLFTERFDFVVGNPPWINWTSLPEDYRNDTKEIWQKHGLLAGTSGHAIGKVSRDISMLFVAECFTRYLKKEEGKKLGFVVPYTLYKTQAGAGFRTFLSSSVHVGIIHDLVDLRPFEGAVNRTSLLIIQAGKTTFPVKCITWVRKEDAKIADTNTLEEIKNRTIAYGVAAEPVVVGKPSESWMFAGSESLSALRAAMWKSIYKAHKGVGTDLNSVFWVTPKSKVGKRVLIENMSNVGQKKVAQRQEAVEPSLLFPLLRGRDVARWKATPSVVILLPHEPADGKPLPESQLKVNFSGAYEYFEKFKMELTSRPNKLLGEGLPFYSAYGIGKYTFADYKVVWKYISGKISGKGKFDVAVVNTFAGMFGEKTVVPDSKVVMIPSNDEDEAHYIAAVLNSSVARLIVAGYAMETAISTHVMNHVGVYPYNPRDVHHARLVELSKQAHEMTRSAQTENVTSIEREIDSVVAGLYSISGKGLDDIKQYLRLIESGPEEEDSDEDLDE